jgi:hypothetical protein
MKPILLVAVVALGACSSESKPEQGTVVASRALADLDATLPDGWTKTYDATADAWDIASGDGATKARVERTDERYVQSPDAYMQFVAKTWGPGRLVTIEERELMGTSGFVVNLAAFKGDSDPAPLRASHVVRKHGKLWYRCFTESGDESRREMVNELCRSIRL